jgi:hypothetical protein
VNHSSSLGASIPSAVAVASSISIPLLDVLAALVAAGRGVSIILPIVSTVLVPASSSTSKFLWWCPHPIPQQHLHRRRPPVEDRAEGTIGARPSVEDVYIKLDSTPITAARIASPSAWMKPSNCNLRVDGV